MRTWIRLGLSPSILRRALTTAGVVGVILTLVNHGGEMLGGGLQPDHVWPIAFTFIVPYVVATISSVAAINGTEAGDHSWRTLSMQPSGDVRDTMLRFYERLSAKDVGSFDELVSADPSTLVIGTAPGEWVTERGRLRYGFEAEGLAIESGGRPTGYENGAVSWFVDEPTYIFPGGSRMHTRLTAILQREDDAWRIVHMHVSVGVPDEEVVALQQRWES